VRFGLVNSEITRVEIVIFEQYGKIGISRQISHNVLDRSSPNFQSWQIYGRGDKFDIR